MTNNEWITWEGGVCPLEPGQFHDRKYRDGRFSYRIKCETIDTLRRAMWQHDGVAEDILAYRVVKD